LQSFFARANYSIASKYFVYSLRVRADGLSRFGENNRLVFSRSGAFAWRSIEEVLWAIAMCYLKLRLKLLVFG